MGPDANLGRQGPLTDLSFVIPAWNESAHLGVTLAALKAAGEASGRSWEIVVADNASTDDTAALARAAGARVVFEPHRQIARARNRGAAEARGRYLFFVDADTVVSPPLIQDALRALDSGACVGGGSVIRFQGNRRLYERLMSPWTWISRTFRLAAGSFVFCRREAWEGIGGFNERLYASEEIAFSRGLKRWGKPRGLDFRVLEGNPPETSPRKMEGATLFSSMCQLLVLSVCPFLLRSRRACFLWYRR